MDVEKPTIRNSAIVAERDIIRWQNNQMAEQSDGNLNGEGPTLLWLCGFAALVLNAVVLVLGHAPYAPSIKKKWHAGYIPLTSPLTWTNPRGA